MIHCATEIITEPSKSSFNASIEEKKTTRERQIYVDMEGKQNQRKKKSTSFQSLSLNQLSAA